MPQDAPIEQITDTWRRQEFPALVAMRRAEQKQASLAGAARTSTGLEGEVLFRMLDGLADGGYIAKGIAEKNAAGDYFVYEVNRLLPLGRRAVGQWPADAREVLLERIAEAVAQASPDVQPKLRRLRDAVLDVPASTVGSLLAGVLQGGVL